jgi:hypothetical protein
MDIHAGTPPIKTAYASKFRELNITGQLDLGYWEPVHVIFTGDYVKNLAFNKSELEAFASNSIYGNVKPGSTGYQLAVTVGHPYIELFGDWKAWFSYKRLESDAVIDAFTDQDFHLGGTNAKGWIVGAEFGLAKNVWLTTKWYSTDEISGNPVAIDIFQFDLNAKF